MERSPLGIKKKPRRILMADDCEADVNLFKIALKKSQIDLELEVVSNGEELLSYLRKEGSYFEKMTPDLILLDINMPRMNGIEALKQIKSHEILRMIPVIILTCSGREEDITTCYTHYANCYIQKPFDANEFIKVVSIFDSFWFSIAALPNLKKS